MLLLKARNPGYVRKDGTYVKPFTDKRPDAAPAPAKWSANPKAPQFSLFPGESSWPFKDAKQAKVHKKEPAAYHPSKGENGEAVGIFRPSNATPAASWDDPDQVATFLPGGDVPKGLHGVPFRAWKDHPRTDDGWDYVDGQMDDLDEPPLKLPAGKSAASGVIIEEPDGRVWLVHPTNQFAGYEATFPKGGAEDGLSLQANAIKECFEESGLQAEITGFFGDFERGTSVARYYTAKRTGGTPTAMGWESQAVSLVPKAQLLDLLNGKADTPVAHAIGAPQAGQPPVDATAWEKVGGQTGSNPGGFFEDADGGEWYCKFPESADHAKNEILASKLYDALGIRAPHMQLIDRGGKIGVASKIIPALVKDKAALMDGSAVGAHEGFAADCWLANWDSVGALFDNMMVDGDGHAVRLDPGGALLFRAQGAPKGAAFGDNVGEIDSLRDGKNKQAAAVFDGVTNAHIRAGVEKIASLSDESIHALVESFGPGTSKSRGALADRLIARKKDLTARFLRDS